MSGAEVPPSRVLPSAADLLVALEVASLCLLVRLETAVLPMSRWLGPREMLRGSQRPSRSDLIAARLRRIVHASLRRRPLRSGCLVRALVLRRMLRRRGIPCQLVISARAGGLGLAAHAEARVLSPEEMAASFEFLLRR